MAVHSGPSLAAQSTQPALFADQGQAFNLAFVEDEEFPLDLSAKYEWELQPASRRKFPLLTSFFGAIAAAWTRVSIFSRCARRLIRPGSVCHPLHSPSRQHASEEELNLSRHST